MTLTDVLNMLRSTGDKIEVKVIQITCTCKRFPNLSSKSAIDCFQTGTFCEAHWL